jgi:peptidyl-prolyl cis-trans isomerase SurA
MPLLTLARPGTLRQPALAAVLAGAWLATACQSSPAKPPAPVVTADTFAVVNGRTISRDAVEKAVRRLQDPGAVPAEEEALAAKLNVLNDLIVQELLIEKAGALKIDVPATELDTAYAKRKENLSDDAYQQELKRRNLTVEDMRDGLRRELLTQKVLEKEVTSKVAISDQMVTDFFNANRAQFHLAEESYHLAQIIITPVREERLANATGDDAATPQAAAAKARMLMEKLKGGASFRDLAVGYSEDPETAPRGGDLGLVPVSQLRQAPQALRDAVLNKEPGTASVASSNGAHTLVLVVAREQAGQRDLSTPGVRDRITETLRSRREQLLRLAYLTALRSDATVTNYLARRVADGTLGAAPAAAPLVAPAPAK